MKTTIRLIIAVAALVVAISANAQINSYFGSSSWEGNTCSGLIATTAVGDAGPFKVEVFHYYNQQYNLAALGSLSGSGSGVCSIFSTG